MSSWLVLEHDRREKIFTRKAWTGSVKDMLQMYGSVSEKQNLKNKE